MTDTADTAAVNQQPVEGAGEQPVEDETTQPLDANGDPIELNDQGLPAHPEEQTSEATAQRMAVDMNPPGEDAERTEFTAQRPVVADGKAVLPGDTVNVPVGEVDALHDSGAIDRTEHDEKPVEG